MACSNVGSTNPDIAGFGVILSFTIQAGISFCLSLLSALLQPGSAVVDQLSQPRNGSTVLSYVGTLLDYMKDHDPVTSLSTLTFSGFSKLHLDQIRVLIDPVLEKISDIQTLNGAITQHGTLSLYHYHIVYDTVNFTGVSAAAALVIVFEKPNAIVFRVVLILVFLSLYFVFVILFGLKLQSWDDSVPGHCYRAGGISTQGAAHPYVDNIYLAITALYLFVSLGIALKAAKMNLQKYIQSLQVAAAPDHRSPSRTSSPNLFSKAGLLLLVQADKDFQQLSEFWFDPPFLVLTVALIQYPVHAYTLFALRKSNEPYLSGDSENQWGFGQVIALVLVASVLTECFGAILKYVLIRWKRQHQGASGDRETSLLPLLTLLLGQEGEQGSSAPREHPTLCDDGGRYP
ncbi:hypothetical protein F4801DRAFT_223408 [Xylaria longipes]|nr:hypothetical protein F4801DRAFT_223408 [Xylaria longipes]